MYWHCFYYRFSALYQIKVDTRIGKRMPFVVGGTAIAVILLMLLGYANAARNAILFVAVLFFLLISMGLYRSPAVALMPDLTPKPLRSKGNAIINLMGAIGGVLTLLLIKFLVGPGETPDYMPLFVAVGGLMVISVGVLFLTVKENKLRAGMVEEDETRAEEPKSTAQFPKEVKRSLIFILCSITLWFAAYNAVTTAFSRYTMEVWGLEGGGYADCLLIATAAAIVSYIPIGMISGKIGRKKTILLGIILITGCYFAASLFSTYSPVMIVFFAIIGFAWAAINVNSLPMVVEISAAGDVGKYTGLYYTFSMSAQVITPILTGFLLEYVSYRTLFPYAVVFSTLSFCTMQMVKHGDNKPVKKASILENFDVED